MNDDFICRKDIERFIVNGLNNPDKWKAFGHDAIEILNEVHFMEPAQVRPVEPAEWKPVMYSPNDLICSNCGWIQGRFSNFCPECGHIMLRYSAADGTWKPSTELTENQEGKI